MLKRKIQMSSVHAYHSEPLEVWPRKTTSAIAFSARSDRHCSVLFMLQPQSYGDILPHNDDRFLHTAGNALFGACHIRFRTPRKFLRISGTTPVPVRFRCSSFELQHNTWLHIPYPFECTLPSFLYCLPGCTMMHNDYRWLRNEGKLRYNPGKCDILS